ncbi:hypothetical protein PSV09DRAFT_2280059 [Bipolaris maydis]|uniref:uncharacterized protein n=1 Tax=Cochliobolus heterostrophus TaxID=5016 RepID=UPI0024DCDC8B|nr:hypothetical protein J3E73DRAFT_274236 [Bipolaris maydis]KAJ5065122.1 hypothetical protein J3E74DRAFT_299487 [Bipolaris maydis]KAJ6213834.1 hypothetical protein PSV09DRAFT_2280059 [Bipolaris maydis]KAJ6275042.1 hypothetical protein PSV08DRAFT_269408 [Bipolaris maydis]
MTLRYDIMLYNGRLGIRRIRSLLFALSIMFPDITFLWDFCQFFLMATILSHSTTVLVTPYLFFSPLHKQKTLYMSVFLGYGRS